MKIKSYDMRKARAFMVTARVASDGQPCWNTVRDISIVMTCHEKKGRTYYSEEVSRRISLDLHVAPGPEFHVAEDGASISYLQWTYDA